MMNLEVEVKFFVPDLIGFRGMLLALGGELVKGRVFERNVRLDTADSALFHRHQLLRLRQDTAVRLTFKGETVEMPGSEAKVREEVETQVADFEKMLTILGRLGFRPVQVYEKYRETFHFGGVEVVLDELPFGNFVELEGEEGAIKTAAFALGLAWDKRILANYLLLMAQVKAQYQLPFDDLTFENFAETAVSVATVLGVV